MNQILSTIVSVAILAGLCAPVNAEEALIGLHWGDSAERVKSTLDASCASLSVKNTNPVQFPLAMEREQHFLCNGLKIDAQTIDSSVFVVADDALQLIEMRGGVGAWLDAREDQPAPYLGYAVYENGKLFVDAEKDVLWVLSKAALHPNLFTWSNPYLDDPDGPAPRYNASAALPSFIKFGEDLENLKAQFEAACPIMNIQEIERIWLPHEPKTQTQVNCFGYEYAGFPRKFEIVFGDGKLELVWILTGKQEEDRVRQALIKEFGAFENPTSDWEVSNDRQIGLRKDKPEVLAISKKLVPFYEEQFFPNSQNAKEH